MVCVQILHSLNNIHLFPCNLPQLFDFLVQAALLPSIVGAQPTAIPLLQCSITQLTPLLLAHHHVFGLVGEDEMPRADATLSITQMAGHGSCAAAAAIEELVHEEVETNATHASSTIRQYNRNGGIGVVSLAADAATGDVCCLC